MKNNALLKRQRLKFLLYNLIAFFIIFIVLGLIAVSSIDGYFYRDADNELSKSREILIADIDNPDAGGKPDDKPDDKAGGEQKAPLGKNPRILYLLYGADRALINGGDIPDYIDYSSLKIPDGDEKTYNQKLGGFNYRVLEFSFLSGQDEYYAQILINIDGEIGLRNNIISIYLICLTVIVVLTVLVSFILSGIITRPIAKAMEKQTQFVSDASHELRTPLTVLQSRLEQLLTYPDDKIIDKSEEISDCLSEVIRLTRLSNSLLSLAKSDADKILPEITEFDIYGLINKVAAPYIEMAKCDDKAFTVTGGSMTVNADSKKIMQALIILFDNALKYTRPSDSIDVSVRKVKNKCEITVADTGIGISEKGIKNIFERFYRDDVSRGATEGSGLGLPIAKQIIEEHKGTVCAQHNTPKGTKIIMTI